MERFVETLGERSGFGERRTGNVKNVKEPLAFHALR